MKSSADFVFIGFLAVLVIFGFVMLASASSDLAKAKFGDSYYYVMHQLYYGLLPGLAGLLAGFLIPYKKLAKFAIPILVLGILSLILVFTPLGISVKGGERWVDLGLFSFQPAELLKLCFFIYLAAWASRSQSRGKSFVGGFLPFLILLGGIMALLLLQPATSTAVLIFIAAGLTYFTAGARMRFLFYAILIAMVGLAVLVYITPYRFERVLSFMNPDADPQGSSYHINQALQAIGSGGLWGVGFGKSTTKLSYLPEPIGDSIFAVLAEEFGFVGSMAFLIVFLSFLWRGFMIAKRAGDNFGRFLATGFMTIMGLQAFVNIAAISGVIPLTGVPLPFISYGGTALTIFLTMSGIIANISKSKR